MSNHLFLGKLLGREGFAEICEVLTSLNSVTNVVTFLTLVSVGSDGNNDFNSMIFSDVSTLFIKCCLFQPICLWSIYVVKKGVSSCISGDGNEVFVLKENIIGQWSEHKVRGLIQLYALFQKRQPHNPQHYFHLQVSSPLLSPSCLPFNIRIRIYIGVHKN